MLAWSLRPAWLAPLDAAQEANLILVRLIEDKTCPVPLLALTPALDDFFRNLPQP